MDNSSGNLGAIRKECWEKSFHSFGKAYIFNKRAQRYGFYINLLKVFGVLVPITVGATAIGYGINHNILAVSITIAIPLSIIQLIFSVFAIVYKWDDNLAYSYEASQDHNSLTHKFSKLAKIPPNDIEKVAKDFEILTERLKARSEQDSKHNVKEWELRMGMRYSLRENQKECIGCRKIPISMGPSSCPVCGNFHKTLTYKLFKP